LLLRVIAFLCVWPVFTGMMLAQLNGGPLPAGSVGNPYSYRFSVHFMGAGPFYFSVNGTLPPGLSLRSDGLLAGTPLQAGYYQNIVIHASTLGPFGTSGSNTYSIVIADPRITLSRTATSTTL
jgi:large repetitive protein